MNGARAFPVEDFVQAFTAQLDRAQDLLALKARTGRPLTFALKDLSVEAAAHVQSCAACREKVARLKAVAAMHREAAAKLVEPKTRLARRQL